MRWRAPADRLIQQLQSELNQPRTPGRAHQAEAGVGHVSVRQSEVRVVEGVEHLGAELEPGALRHSDIFLDSDIPVGDAGAGQHVPSRVPEVSRGRIAEAGRVELLQSVRPEIAGQGGISAVANAIRTLL